MTDTLSNTGAEKLKSFVERIERLNEDRAAVVADLAEVYGEVKGEGFSPKILRKVIALRAQDKAAREEEAALIDLYMSAVQGDLFRRDTEVSIEFPGHEPIKTTTAALARAANAK